MWGALLTYSCVALDHSSSSHDITMHFHKTTSPHCTPLSYTCTTMNRSLLLHNTIIHLYNYITLLHCTTLSYAYIALDHSLLLHQTVIHSHSTRPPPLHCRTLSCISLAPYHHSYHLLSLFFTPFSRGQENPKLKF